MNDKIKEFTEKFGVMAAAKEFNSTPWIIRKKAEWNMQKQLDFLKRKRTPEVLAERKRRRKEMTDKWNRRPDVTARRLKFTERWRRLHPLVALASDYNLKYRHSGIVRPIDYWSQLKKQKMICPYTGVKITRENMSIDHIIPMSKGGRHVKENIQIVHSWANLMKLDYPEEIFLKMIAKIFHNCNLIERRDESFNPPPPSMLRESRRKRQQPPTP